MATIARRRVFFTQRIVEGMDAFMKVDSTDSNGVRGAGLLFVAGSEKRANPQGWRPTGSARLLAVLLIGQATVAAATDSALTACGRDPTGPHVVVVVPAPLHDASVGLGRQLTSLPLERGKLTVLETSSVPDADGLATFLAEKLPADEPPTCAWVHGGADPAEPANDGVTKPTVRVEADRDQHLAALATRAVGTEVVVECVAPKSSSSGFHDSLKTFVYPSGTPRSRQIRYTRLLVTEMLRHEGLLAVETNFSWQRLHSDNRRLIALYDAEGIAGTSPAHLERIATERLDDAGCFLVCGEDIREGALAPAAGVIFPGGSGKKIAEGLQPEGRRRVRDFIQAGGGYLGVCAGAYFAASGSKEYLNAIPLKHSRTIGWGRSMVNLELTAEGIEIFGESHRVVQTQFSGGPVFLAAEQADSGDPNIVVLARFTSPSTDAKGNEMVGEAAIGAVRYGQGRMLIMSPHPETHEETYGLVARAIQWTLRRAGSE